MMGRKNDTLYNRLFDRVLNAECVQACIKGTCNFLLLKIWQFKHAPGSIKVVVRS